MKILLLSRYFPPEIGTAANLFFELAVKLKELGHEVTVATSFPSYNMKEIPLKYKRKLFMEEELKGVKVLRARFPQIGTNKIRLAIGYVTTPFSSLIAGLSAARPDIIYYYSPPLFIGIAGWLLSRIKKVPLVMGVQDIHPQGYIDLGVMKNKTIIRFFESIEKFCYKKADAITVHSQGNKDFLVMKKGVPADKIKVLNNWIDTDEMKPLPRVNDFSARYGLNDKFVAGYAGNLGISQAMVNVVEAANILKDKKEIEFFIVGDGSEKNMMMERAKALGLKNIRFIGMQPKSLYPSVVASCDVGLVTLRKEIKTPVVPSKIISMMAAARPVLASMPLDGDAPKLIKDSGCGICIDAENPGLLAEKILYLANNPQICKKYGEDGRQYCLKYYSLDVIAKEIEKIFGALGR